MNGPATSPVVSVSFGHRVIEPTSARGRRISAGGRMRPTGRLRAKLTEQNHYDGSRKLRPGITHPEPEAQAFGNPPTAADAERVKVCGQ